MIRSNLHITTGPNTLTPVDCLCQHTTPEHICPGAGLALNGPLVSNCFFLTARLEVLILASQVLPLAKRVPGKGVGKATKVTESGMLRQWQRCHYK